MSKTALGRSVATLATAWGFVALPLAGPASAAAPNLPNPCKLITVAEINTMLGKSAGAKPVITHQTFQSGTAYEQKICRWTYGKTSVFLDDYAKSGGSGGAFKSTPEPSLGPHGVLRQGVLAADPFTGVGFFRHALWVDIGVNKTITPKRILALGKDAYNSV